MTPDEIMRGMAEKGRLLTSKNDELKKLSESFADAKRDYRVSLAQAILKMKLAGHPATLNVKLSQGECAEAERKMDIAEGVLNACRESIKDTREAIGAYRSLLTWQRAELNNGD